MLMIILCIMAAVALLMLYTIRQYMAKKDISSLTSEADGEIVRVTKLDYKDTDSGEKKTMYTLKVIYSVGGKQYKTGMRTREDGVSFQEGQSVTVLYDEADPRHAIVKGDRNPQDLWREHFIAAVILLVLPVVVIVIILPSILGFSEKQRDIFNMVLKAAFFLALLVGMIVYSRSKTYKAQREKGVSVRKEMVAFVVILAKLGFDIIFDIIKLL